MSLRPGQRYWNRGVRFADDNGDGAAVDPNDPAVKAVVDALQLVGITVNVSRLPDPSVLPQLLQLVDPASAARLGQSAATLAGATDEEAPQSFSDRMNYLERSITHAGRQQNHEAASIGTEVKNYLRRRKQQGRR